MSLDLLCKVKVDQFFGIEIEEFPALIARTALYLADHIANREVSAELGEHYVRFPIPASPHVVIANALRVDWNDVLPADEADFVFGNPPFAGQKTRAADQTADMRAVWGPDFARWLDYVTGWYRIAADYLADSTARVAFVSTNSITQGEQVARVWRPLLDRGLAIDFAHRTFAWTSEARGKAHVHVVIVAFSKGGVAPRKTLYDYASGSAKPIPTTVRRISPYLIDAPDVLVQSAASPISTELPPVLYGNKPSDGGHLVVDERDLPDAEDPATKYLRPYLGARELLHGERRSCIWMDAPDPDAVRGSQFLRTRLAAVRDFRENSTAADTRKYASMPWRFFRIPQPTSPYLAIPRHVSSTRRWFTVSREPANTIASDALFTVVDPDGFAFSVLSSAMFMAWLRTVGGRLKSDLRFSGPIVYNTFPMPAVTDDVRLKLITAGRFVADARSNHPDRSLAGLYDPLAMPRDLLDAHAVLDRAVDAVFGKRKHQDDASRMRVLLPRYVEMTGGDPTLFDEPTDS
jgi:hypothetical protein